MTKTIVYPGAVDWSGENPGMYLKEQEDGPFMAGGKISTAFLAFSETWIKG